MILIGGGELFCNDPRWGHMIHRASVPLDATLNVEGLFKKSSHQNNHIFAPCLVNELQS